MVAQVLNSGMATLLELKYDYTFEDMYNLWEVYYTRKYNEWCARERAIEEERMRRGL